MPSYSEAIKNAEQAYNVGKGGDWYELKEGSNAVRVLSWSEVYPQHFSPSGYKGICVGAENKCPGCAEGTKPSIKWLTWVSPKELNTDNEVEYGEPKLAKFPHQVLKKLQNIQEDPDYAFTEFPMPYDIKITKRKTGSKPTDIEYDVIPGKHSELPAEIANMVAPLKSTESIRKAMKDKKLRELGVVPAEEVKSLEEVASGVEYPSDGGIGPDDIPF